MYHSDWGCSSWPAIAKGKYEQRQTKQRRKSTTIHQTNRIYKCRDLWTESDDGDTELVEEQVAVNCRQELTGNTLPSVVQFENLENQIYQCAPVENNIPKYILLDNDFEVLAFPDLFPYGGGGYHSAQRKVKLPIRKYFQHCLLNVDGRFAQNIEYLFCAQYIADMKQIESDATLAIMLSQGRTLGRAQDHSWTCIKSSSSRTACQKWTGL